MLNTKKNVMPEEFFSSAFLGYEVTCASISSSKHIQICAKEKIGPEGMGMNALEDYPYRIFSYVPDDVSKNNGFHKSEWRGIGYLYSVIVPSERKGITLTDVFRVSERGVDILDICKPREEWDDFTRSGHAIRIIGNHVYAAGQISKLFRRDSIGKWEDLTDPKQHPNLFKHAAFIKERDGSYLHANIGFTAFDGFDEQSIYAGGDKTLWCYDGLRWYEQDLPEYPNRINAVLCAGDGCVYVTGRGGPILKGRDDQWEILDTPALDYKSLAWFDGKLWIGSDYELGVYENGNYKRYEFPSGGPAQYSFMGVDACEDRLLSYGPDQVMLFDGEKWVEMIGPRLV